MEELDSRGIFVSDWNIDTNDWSSKTTAESIVSEIKTTAASKLGATYKTALVLMHNKEKSAAALPGVIAANTTLPVIGVPIKGSVLDGVDALYSIIQMPPGIPVATVAINGAMNAAILAVQMIALSDEELAKKFAAYKEGLKNKIVKANEELKEVKYAYKTN